MNETETKQEIARLQAVLENQKRAQTDEITEHISTARKLTPKGTGVRHDAFEEFIRAFEELYSQLKRRGSI